MNSRGDIISAIVNDLPERGRVLFIGAADTGKSTLAADSVRALAELGRLPIAVIDGDIGQSEIGPPASVGLGVLHEPVVAGEPRALSHIPSILSTFVGATTPVSHVVESGSAIIQTTQAAALLSPRPERILIDTPGLVIGAGASLLRLLIAVIRPHLIVALARGNELEPILRPVEATSNGTRILRLAPSPEVGRKSANVRATRRAARILQHLRDAQPIILPWNSVALENTTITYGAPLPPHELRFIGDTLGGECLYAERQPGGQLTAILASNPPPTRPANTAPLELPLKATRVVTATSSRFDHLLCGLYSPKGELLEIGVITKMDFARREMEILTRVRHVGAVGRVTLGYVRVRPDGREIRTVPAGQAI